MKDRIKEGLSLVNIAGLIIILAGVIYAKAIIKPCLLALFISIICAQPMTWLEKKKIPGWLALIIVMLGLFLLFTGFAFLFGNTLSSFSGNLSKYESDLTMIRDSFVQYLNEKGLNIRKDQIFSLIQPAKILSFTAGALNKIFDMVGTTFLVFLVIFFILMEFWSFSVKVRTIQTNKSISYFSTILHNIRNYLGIKTLLCILVAILIFFVLLIIGVDYPLMWALIAGLTYYIPNIGSIISMVPTVLFALVQLGFGGALWTLGGCTLVHIGIGNFMEPRIMGKGLGLSTLVVLLSLVFWGFILGIAGMFLSVPITLSIKIIMEQDEKTKWIAILLGTPGEAKAYLDKQELIQNRQQNKANPKVN